MLRLGVPILVALVAMALPAWAAASGPPPASDLVAAKGGPPVSLNWTNPSGIDGDVLVRGASCPTGPYDGSRVVDPYNGTVHNSFADASAHPGGSYCYAVFTTSGGAYSSGV